MAMARDEQIDAAVLDVNLNDQRSDPIAGVLKDRGIPYLLATGYGDAVTSSEVPVLSKPYTPESLVQALGRLPMNQGGS